jgi:hypothetical protein
MFESLEETFGSDSDSDSIPVYMPLESSSPLLSSSSNLDLFGASGRVESSSPSSSKPLRRHWVEEEGGFL